MDHTERQTKLTEQGLSYFGRMSASATHEIKNCLAIMNENSGLLEDLGMLSKEGVISSDRVNAITGKIKKQIKRANDILKKLNLFSHSSDVHTEAVDLQEVVRFTADMGSRLIEMKRVAVEIIPASSAVSINSNRFFLENMIWRSMEKASDMSGEGGSVTISFIKDNGRAGILFAIQPKADSSKEDKMEDLFSSEGDLVLIDYLGLSVEKQIEKKEFRLLWEGEF